MSSSTLHNAGKKRKIVGVKLLDGTVCSIYVDVSSTKPSICSSYFSTYNVVKFTCNNFMHVFTK